jgi:chaperonin cofactor prefoldin
LEKKGELKEERGRIMRKCLVVFLAMLFLTACSNTANSNETDYQSEIDDMQSMIDEIDTRISDLESQNEELTSQNEELQNNLDDVLSRLNDLEMNQSY